MANEILPGIPSVPVDVSTAWEPLVDQHVLMRRGDNQTALTNWGETNPLEPAVSAGSAFEVNGSALFYGSEVEILHEAGCVAGTVYVIVDISDNVNGDPIFVNDAPVWKASSNGFYRGANERYTGHMMQWDGNVTYTYKEIFGMKNQAPTTLSFSPGGGINTDNFAMRVKKFVVTRASADAGFAHGLDASNILGMTAYVHFAASAATDNWYGIGQGYGLPQSGDANAKWSTSTIEVSNLNTTWDYIKILVFYME